jgi:hypothetical protein
LSAGPPGEDSAGTALKGEGVAAERIVIRNPESTTGDGNNQAPGRGAAGRLIDAARRTDWLFRSMRGRRHLATLAARIDNTTELP